MNALQLSKITSVKPVKKYILRSQLAKLQSLKKLNKFGS